MMVRGWVSRKWVSAVVREKQLHSTKCIPKPSEQGKIGDIFAPPKVTPANNHFYPKPNHLLNKLDTTPDPPIFPPKTNNFQKPMSFVKEGEKKPQPKEKPKPKPKPILFHCDYFGRDGHK
jgi:hypothetical protein